MSFTVEILAPIDLKGGKTVAPRGAVIGVKDRVPQ